MLKLTCIPQKNMSAFFCLLTVRLLNSLHSSSMDIWLHGHHSGCAERMACAAVVSVGQKGSTLREDVKTYSHTVIRTHYKDTREAVVFTYLQCAKTIIQT